jgi:hypothetical protein
MVVVELLGMVKSLAISPTASQFWCVCCPKWDVQGKGWYNICRLTYVGVEDMMVVVTVQKEVMVE